MVSQKTEKESGFCLDCVSVLTLSCVILDYKNNLLREKVHMNTQPKVIDLDKGNARAHTHTHANSAIMNYLIFILLNLYFIFAEMQKFSK